MTTTNQTTKTVTIKTSNVGQNFGCVGLVVARNGRVLHETVAVPRGDKAAAVRLATEWAERNGRTVR